MHAGQLLLAAPFLQRQHSPTASTIAMVLASVLAGAALVGCIQPTNISSSCTLGPGRESHRVVKESNEIWPYQVYHSSPFNPPELEITKNGQPLAPGLLFITPEDFTPIRATRDVAPLIMTDTGQLVWNGPTTNATNFRVASYDGNPILTYWTGISTAGANVGHGYGNITFLDSSYDEILTVCPQLDLVIPENIKYPCQADFHESYVTDRGTLIITAYNATQTDLSSIDGPQNGWVFDCLFFELDPKSGDVLFKWSALEHVPVDQSKLPLKGTGLNQSAPFDYFHLNSVVNIGGNYLANSRHLWTTYMINAKGDIIWTLEGDNGGDFGTLPADGKFSWQHYARPHNITNSSMSISYFNNRNAFGTDNGSHPSNGLELKLSLPPSKSTPPLPLEYLSDPTEPLYAGSQGSLTFLCNGNIFLGYGEIAVMKEFGPNDPSGGDVRWTARFGTNDLVQSYRAFRTEWHGMPKTIPSLVIAPTEGSNKTACRSAGYVSWNGATDVEGWAVSEGPAQDQLQHVGDIRYRGFETEFLVAQPCVQAAAIINGVQGTKSNVVCA